MKKALSLAVAFTVAACADIRNDTATLPQDVVDRAAQTVAEFKTDPELTEFVRVIDDASAVVVLPTVIKAGFIGGGEAGNGVLLARGADGSWSYPAFYTLGAASVGLQAGVHGSEIVMAVRSTEALDALLDHQAKLGADVGLTVGFMGIGGEAATTSNLGADIVAVARSIGGLYAGASLEGAVLARRSDLNESYYGRDAPPRDITNGRQHANTGAEALRAALAGR